MSSIKEPFFSVIMPTYNHGHYIKKAIDSVISQSFQDWELIVVNNFSSDNTEEIVKAFNDPRITLRNFANNGVVSASRNEGIRLARGQYVACLDSDDCWYPEKLSLTRDVIQKENADVVSHHLIRNINGKLGTLLKNGPERATDFSSLLFNGNCLTNSSVVIRRDCANQVGGFSTEQKVITAEDYEMWLKLSYSKFKFKIIDMALGEYYIHSTNLSSAIERHMKATLNVFEMYYARIESKNWLHQLRRRMCLGRIYYGAARQAGTQGRFTLGVSLYSKSLALNPLRLKTHVGIAIFFFQIFKRLVASPRQLEVK